MGFFNYLLTRAIYPIEIPNEGKDTGEISKLWPKNFNAKTVVFEGAKGVLNAYTGEN